MIKIGIIGDIGSGKTFVANQFGYPVFNADIEVSKIYKNIHKLYTKYLGNPGPGGGITGPWHRFKSRGTQGTPGNPASGGNRTLAPVHRIS